MEDYTEALEAKVYLNRYGRAIFCIWKVSDDKYPLFRVKWFGSNASADLHSSEEEAVKAGYAAHLVKS